MSEKSSISISVIRRLPRYYRFLGELLKTGCARISSRELSEKMGLTASQIRQDLNCFGGFGQQGYGYNVTSLHEEIAAILGLDKVLPTIVIGVGNLGKAIVTHMNFNERGFDIVGMFDQNPELIGKSMQGVEIKDVDEVLDFCKTHTVKVAILCIPKTSTKKICDILVGAGVKCFWNFSHYDLSLQYDDVVVENVHLSDSLMTLCYRANQRTNK